MELFKLVAEVIGLTVDAAGVVVIVVGVLVAMFRYASRRVWTGDSYRLLRQDIGRGILLGLELLVAADIIRTVAVSPTLNEVTVLAIIVLIRTFLSMALQIELDGRLPWRTARAREP